MREVTLYVKTTGELGPMLSNTPEAIDAMVTEKLGCIDGHWSSADWKVDLSTLTIAAKADDLMTLKVAKWETVKRERTKQALGGCDTPLGRVDTDEVSQANINGSVSGAMIAQSAGIPYSVEWTMADNSVVRHDASDMIAMGVTVLQHIAACYGRARELRVAIDAATSEAELEAIVWDAAV